MQVQAVPIAKFARRTQILFNASYATGLYGCFVFATVIRALVFEPRPIENAEFLIIPAAYVGAWLALGYRRAFFVGHIVAAVTVVVSAVAWVATRFPPPPPDVVGTLVHIAMNTVVIGLPTLVVGRWLLFAWWTLRTPIVRNNTTLPQLGETVRKGTWISRRAVRPPIPLVGKGLIGLGLGLTLLLVVELLLDGEPVAHGRGGVTMFNLFCAPPFIALMLGLGYRLDRPDANRLLRESTHPPTLLLRSFGDEHYSVTRRHLWLRLASWFWDQRLEAALAEIIERMGPFVAIGRPGEVLPRLGAARTYFDDETWQDAILDWMERAQLVVMLAGETHWVTWELRQLASRGLLEKLIVMFPPDVDSERDRRWTLVKDVLRETEWGQASESLDITQTLAVRFAPKGRIIVVRSRPSPAAIDYEIALNVGIESMLVERGTLDPNRSAPPATVASRTRHGRGVGALVGALGTLAMTLAWAAVWQFGPFYDYARWETGVGLGLTFTALVPPLAGLVSLLRFDGSDIPAGRGWALGVRLALRAAVPAATILGIAVCVTAPLMALGEATVLQGARTWTDTATVWLNRDAYIAYIGLPAALAGMLGTLVALPLGALGGAFLNRGSSI
ncbi:MAG: hypothetical protein AAGA48_30030 [Myxococcota bacterium]